MKQADILKKLLPGFLPILIFILAEEIWGTKIGLIVALATGIIELIVYRIKDKRFDKFILFDTLLILILGGISLAFDNDTFFKIKPAIMSLLVCAVLAVSVFTPKNILLGMSKRYTRGMEIPENSENLFNKSMKSLLWIFLGYTALVFYSVWFMSTEMWAFISGGLFYIIFGVYAVYQFIKTRFFNKVNTDNVEYLPIIDEKGKILGKAPREICHRDKTYLHPVVHLHIFNESGDLFLQKRLPSKTIQPNRWDTAVGGHVSFGESIEQALAREIKEETGLEFSKPTAITQYIWESECEREMVFLFAVRSSEIPEVDKAEASEGKFWKIRNLEKLLSKGIFTPNFEFEYSNILKKINFKTLTS